MTHLRGLHEVRRGSAVSAASGKSQQGKLSARLARLDHQRTLLESQLAVWVEKQRVTRHRLDLLGPEVPQIGRQIRGLIKPRRQDRRRPAGRSDPGRRPDGGGSTGGGEISFEY